MIKNKEKKLRTFFKTVSWRVIATLTTVMIAYSITNDFSISLGIGGFEVISKLLLYYFHERLWTKISWGHYN